MEIQKIFGVKQAAANPINRTADNNFVKNSFNFENANPNRPESRDDIHGRHLYCLA